MCLQESEHPPMHLAPTSPSPVLVRNILLASCSCCVATRAAPEHRHGAGSPLTLLAGMLFRRQQLWQGEGGWRRCWGNGKGESG